MHIVDKIMVLSCIWCGARINAYNPRRMRRNEASCAEPPPAQTSGPKRSGVIVCELAACQAKMLPRAVEGVFTEWAQFHNTRRLVTSLRHSGLTTQQAFTHLELATGMITEHHSAKILGGLQRCYRQEGARKMYDPEFDDPAFHMATSNLSLTLSTPDFFWWSVWCMLMRFNRELLSKQFQLWLARSKEVFDEILDGVCLSSITTRGNESDDMVRERMWVLRGWFKSDTGARVAQEQMDLFKTGVLFQQIIEDYPLPSAVRPEMFKEPMANFKPYFIGKVLSETSPSFKHADLVGGSLVATSKKDNGDSFQLYDILASAELPPGFLQPSSSKRIRWGVWCYAHFNQERGRLNLHTLPDGKIEHSGCEYIRYCRECWAHGWLECIPTKTLERIQLWSRAKEERPKKKSKRIAMGPRADFELEVRRGLTEEQRLREARAVRDLELWTMQMGNAMAEDYNRSAFPECFPPNVQY